MAEIGIKQLKASASEVVGRVEGGVAYIITKRGRPAAAIVPIDQAEDLVLANANEYLRLRREGRTAYVKGNTTSLDEAD
jgi:prevent-host-death family protein